MGEKRNPTPERFVTDRRFGATVAHFGAVLFNTLLRAFG